jgi:cytochrome oxidase Cu insertion factor (SCO1/SenC/PrrC family)
VYKPHWKRWSAVLLFGAALCAGTAQAQTLKEGDQAPPFSVMSTTGKEIALSDFQGKKAVVLFFYFAAFTGT